MNMYFRIFLIAFDNHFERKSFELNGDGGETKVMNSTIILFQTSFYLSSSSQRLSNEGKYMIEDVVKSQCNKDVT